MNESPDPTTSFTPPARDPLLVERQNTHGDFDFNAEISQGLKKAFKAPYKLGMECQSTMYEHLPAAQREALDMIALKISRILSGKANFKDHWDDIAGYAKLGAEACSTSTN